MYLPVAIIIWLLVLVLYLPSQLCEWLFEWAKDYRIWCG